MTKEREAEERLAKAQEPPPQPRELAEALQAHQEAETRREAAFWALAEVEKELDEKRRTRPDGVWAWLSGRTRRHDREAAEVQQRHDAAKDSLVDARKASGEIKDRVDRLEREFERAKACRALEMAPEARRAREEMAWMRDARACIEADPLLARGPAEDLVRAVEEKRQREVGERARPEAVLEEDGYTGPMGPR